MTHLTSLFLSDLAGLPWIVPLRLTSLTIIDIGLSGRPYILLGLPSPGCVPPSLPSFPGPAYLYIFIPILPRLFEDYLPPRDIAVSP